METGVTVKNLTATTVDGWSISAAGDDPTGYAHETNTRDNGLKDSIPLYSKGTMTKANAFCTAGLYDNKGADFTAKNYFLGTYFWGTSAYQRGRLSDPAHEYTSAFRQRGAFYT